MNDHGKLPLETILKVSASGIGRMIEAAAHRVELMEQNRPAIRCSRCGFLRRIEDGKLIPGNGANRSACVFCGEWGKTYPYERPTGSARSGITEVE